jgi:hypothetical protein
MAALYHFTAPATSHLGSILREGRIRVTESNVSFDEEHAGPPVVWLTSNGEQHGHGWHAGGPKLGARLTVEAQAEHYPAWARAHGVSTATLEALAASGGDPAEWWVVPRPIYRPAIVALRIYADEQFGLSELHVEGAELRRLFQSRGAQRALGLVESKRRVLR